MRNGYFGYILKITDGNSIDVEHLERAVYLERAERAERFFLAISENTDVQEEELTQVLPIKTESEWDYIDPEVSILSVKNASGTSSCFRTLFLET